MTPLHYLIQKIALIISSRRRKDVPSIGQTRRAAPGLEVLEDRIVPSVAATSFLGPLNNATGPNLNLPQSGFVVLNPPQQGLGTAQQNTVAIAGAGQGNAAAYLVGAADVNSFGHIPGSFASMFPASSVNSLGLGIVKPIRPLSTNLHERRKPSTSQGLATFLVSAAIHGFRLFSTPLVVVWS
jgi:hypothetical protein